jgi:hypothetical protein
MLGVLRKLFFWNYGRNTWQWDALCVVILVFIFLTPKSWFENSERRGVFAHQSSTVSTILVGPEVVENAEDKVQIERRLRELTGRKQLRVINVRKLTSEQGRIQGYEVDID